MNNSFTSKEYEKSLHYQNKIKQSGYLIALDKETLSIQFVSENICDLLDREYSLDEIIGLKLEYIFPFNLDFDSLDGQSAGEYEKKFIISNEKKYFLIYYHYKDLYYIELEEDNTTNSQFYTENFTERIIFSKTKEDNWQNLINAVKEITQYNRVMIFKFDANYTAKCIAEKKDEGLESVLDLKINKNYIGNSDLVLMKKKRNSYISFLDEPTINLFSQSDQKINLIYSEFNPISDQYFEKLKKLNINSFFSISIVVNQKLWGILVCTNTQPKHIPLSKRLQCVRLTRFARVSFVNFKYDEKTKFRHRFNQSLHSIKENLLIENGFEKISHNLPGMLNFTNANGIALVNLDNVFCYGDVPSKDEIFTIKKWAFNEGLTDTFFSNTFYRDYGLELGVSEKSYGISCKILDASKHIFIIWFKKYADKDSLVPNEICLPDSLLQEFKDSSTSTKKVVIKRELKSKKHLKWKDNEMKIIQKIVQIILKTIHTKSYRISELHHQLQEVNYELNSFSNSISHDLRTPLAVMRLNCQVLQKSLESHNLNYGRIDNVITEIDNLTEMMQEILNLSKAKNSELNLQEIDCESLLNKIIKESIIYNDINQIEISLGMLHPIYSDKTMAYEIFSNMINNAIKYSSKQEQPKLEISSVLLNNQVIYKFKDNGIGIKESDREKMFKLFSRMSNSSGFKGSGVGLSIVHRMMERLDGSIDYTSEENKGTEFILKFNLPY